MSEIKFFLKDFFKYRDSRRKSFDVLWNNTGKKVEQYEKEIQKNIKKMGDVEAVNFSIPGLKDIYNEYQNIWKKYRTVKESNPKQLKKYFLILFSNPKEGVLNGLYDNPEQFDDFLEALIKKNKQRYLKILISILLEHYPKEKHLLFERLRKLYNSLDKQKRGNKLLIEANTKFQLIEKEGPLIIAQNIMDIKKNLSNEVLSKIWLKERHLISNGIGQNIVKELCSLAKKPIQEENEVILDRFLKYLSGANNIARFSDSQPIVSVLLRPFEKKTPTQSVKKEITKFLDQYVGDPRFESEKWVNMSKEKSIFLKWKIGETIKDFMKLLSYTAKQNPDSDRMWPYRKEFIASYWNARYIKNAWIVLGKEAYKNRLRFLKEGFDSYGRIVKGANPVHSVLLFQIGDLILSEWNYNGKVRAWTKGNKNVPQMYKTEYLKEELIKKPNKEITHRYPEKYYWQKNLSKYIERYTGIPCPELLQRKIDKFQ